MRGAQLFGVGYAAARAFEYRTRALDCHAPFARGARRPGRNATFWFLGCRLHELLQARQRIAPIGFLRAKASGVNYQHVVRADPPPRQPAQSRFDLHRQGPARANVETQLDGRGYLVDVLPTGARSAHMAEFQFCFGYRELPHATPV